MPARFQSDAEVNHSSPRSPHRSANWRSLLSGSSKPGKSCVVYDCSAVTVSISTLLRSNLWTVIVRSKRSMIQYSRTPIERYSCRFVS